MRDIILNTINDLVGDFLYYGRKEDFDLPRGAIEKAIENKEISIDEIAAFFKFELIKRLNT